MNSAVIEDLCSWWVTINKWINGRTCDISGIFTRNVPLPLSYPKILISVACLPSTLTPIHEKFLWKNQCTVNSDMLRHSLWSCTAGNMSYPGLLGPFSLHTPTSSFLDLENLLPANPAELQQFPAGNSCAAWGLCKVWFLSVWRAGSQRAPPEMGILRGRKLRGVVPSCGQSYRVSASTVLSWLEPNEEGNCITHLITKPVQVCCGYQHKSEM